MRDIIIILCLCNLMSFILDFYYISIGIKINHYLFQQIKAKSQHILSLDLYHLSLAHEKCIP